MAKEKNKSQAQKAADTKEQKSVKNKPTKQNTTNHKETEESKVSVPETKERAIPLRLITSAVILTLFVVMLIILLAPGGVFLAFFGNLVNGLIGKAGFIAAIPCLLYMFVIHAFSGKRPIKMRTICLIVFVLLCGCISHLVLRNRFLIDDKNIIKGLYFGGINGTTGGLLCGSITELLYYFFHKTLTFIILIVSAIFVLLGSMQITVISIVRAVRNRPRADSEDIPEERPEPAAIVVNHIANKRIEHLENKREARLQQKETVVYESYLDVPPEDPVVRAPRPQKEVDKAADLFRQIDKDIEMPVTAANASTPEPVIVPEEQPATESASKMPPLVMDEPLPEKPVRRVKPEKVTAADKVTAKEAKSAAQEVAQEIAEASVEEKPAYCFPPVDLLRFPGGAAADGTSEMRENSRRLNETLDSFRIDAQIVNVTRGPSVTRYEVELRKGVKLSKLTSAADDIALSLGAVSVRIAAIPGKISVVGIEVPNQAVTTVSLREVIDSNEFNKAKSKSSFAVGKDIGGSCIVGNIAKLPHMLIAGTTGSGKSVCMNSLIISLLYKASPDEVKLIMVDPKMVELGIYNGIPHLLIPVVTDPKKAAGSLQWAVSEMMRRYKAMSTAGVRDLESYNALVENQAIDGGKFPQVVVVIDELADLMIVAKKEVEESICRIAQMGRASGIHLVIATQRPSADVITGLMKANIPSRIAFAVSSAMESRIILDYQGAERLVGKGDMLYAPIGSGEPKRVQGCFVTDEEVEAVTNFIKENFSSGYDQSVMDDIEKRAAQTGNKPAATVTASDPEPNADELDGDEMLPAAVDVILETGQASVSMLQRRLKLGYARAARIVDEMEEKGIVGPFQGSKPRDILVTKEQWASMRSGVSSNAQMDFDDLQEDADGFDDEDFES